MTEQQSSAMLFLLKKYNEELYGKIMEQIMEWWDWIYFFSYAINSENEWNRKIKIVIPREEAEVKPGLINKKTLAKLSTRQLLVILTVFQC